MEQMGYFKSKFVSLLFFRKKLQLISEIRSLSADCLPILIKASGCGVSTSQFYSAGVSQISSIQRGFDPKGYNPSLF
jgi:hypothetical protein